MASFADLSANLKLNIQDFARNLRTASGQVERFSANVRGTTVEAMRELNRETNAWGLNVKSVSRVVSGILISQAFYGMTQQISSATNAVWEFTKQLEYAQIAYSNMFGDVALAQEFINVLKDFAAETPFSFGESEKAAKRLLAYGIEYKNVMYVMEGVMTAAAAQGDPQRVEQISRAMGQIFTYGKLMTAEVRQLTEAGIPAYEILQEELGLTQDQLRNLGNEAIPASDAINALVDGITKRFGNVFDASSKTITGIISNIKDNATMLASGLTEPLTVAIKSALVEVGEFLFAMREMFELKGAGGVFEAIVPPELRDTLRQTAAILLTLVQAVMRLGIAIGNILKPVVVGLITSFNALMPIIINVTNVIATLIQMAANNTSVIRALTVALAAASAMWVVFKVRALATAAISAVIAGIAKALAVLGAVLTFVVNHPFWTLLIGLAGLVVGVSGGFGKLSDSIGDVFKKITAFNGVDPDTLLLPSQKDRANDIDKFNKKLEGTSDAMDDLAGSTGKANKAAKSLLSFDEVFRLNEPDEGSGSGSGIADAGLEDLLSDLSSLGGAFVPEVPDFSTYTKAITDGFINNLKEYWDKAKAMIEPIISSAVGAGIGALLGTIVGGKLGGKIGLVAGAIAGYFWNMLADKFNLTPEQKVQAGIITGIGTGIGAIIGGVLGGPGGAKIGAAIGGLAGSLWGMFAESIGVTAEQHVATAIGMALGGVVRGGIALFKSLAANLIPTYIDDAFVGFSRSVGFSFAKAIGGALKQGIAGALTGLGVGMLANALTAWIADELSLTEADLANSGAGQTIGSIVGTIAGLILGGPVGSIVGGALGQLAGSIVGEFWNYINTTFKGTIIGSVAGLPIGALVGTIVGSIGGPLGAAIGAVAGGAIGTLIGLIVDKWDTIKGFFAEVGKSISDTFTSVAIFLNDIAMEIDATWTLMYEYVSSILNDVWTVVHTVWTDITNAISTFLSDIWSAVTTVWNDILSAISTVMQDISSVIDLIWTFIKDLTIKIATDIWKAIDERFGWIFDAISAKVNLALNVISTVFTSIYNVIKERVTAAYNAARDLFTSIYNTVQSNVSAAYTVVSTIFTSIYNIIKERITAAYNAARGLFESIYNTVKSNVTGTYTSVRDAFTYIYDIATRKISDMYSTIKTGVSNIYTTFTDWISNLWSNVFDKFFGWISDGISKLREFFRLNDDASSVSIPTPSSGVTAGHATGGIFNREHIARFAEGNKAEAVIPLENNTAMKPFVDAISRGIVEGIAPTLVSVGGGQSSQLPPMYIGTLVADDRGLKELYKKFEIIQVQENARKGLAY